jgi:hypothetical protein
MRCMFGGLNSTTTSYSRRSWESANALLGLGLCTHAWLACLGLCAIGSRSWSQFVCPRPSRSGIAYPESRVHSPAPTPVTCPGLPALMTPTRGTVPSAPNQCDSSSPQLSPGAPNANWTVPMPHISPAATPLLHASPAETLHPLLPLRAHQQQLHHHLHLLLRSCHTCTTRHSSAQSMY